MNRIQAKTLGVLAMALTVVGFAVVPAMGSAATTSGGTAGPRLEVEPLLESCGTGNVCTWTGANYTGTRTETSCINNSYNIATSFSAKNRCTNTHKAVEFGWKEGESINIKFCMEPGGNRPEPGRFNWFSVEGSETHC
jgi:hypothetical protein